MSIHGHAGDAILTFRTRRLTN